MFLRIIPCCWVVMLATSVSGQFVISNPSFEGGPNGSGAVPAPWSTGCGVSGVLGSGCAYGTTADSGPSIAGGPLASNGSQLIGMGGNDCASEALFQALSEPLQPCTTYTFTIDAAQSASFFTPAVNFFVWGTNSPCSGLGFEADELLFSTTVSSVSMAPVLVSFTPTSTYDHLVFSMSAISPSANGFLFLDNIRDLSTTATGDLAITAAITNASCGLDNGAISVTAVAGGSAPYTYGLNSQATSAQANYSDLSAGTYALQVVDAGGCVLDTTLVVNGSTSLVAPAIALTATRCGEANGSIGLGPLSGGTAPFVFRIDGVELPDASVVNDLAPGDYSIDVTDANGCRFDTTLTIASSDRPEGVVFNVFGSGCRGGTGGVEVVDVIGGVGPYSLSVDGAVRPDLSATGLAAGAYTLGLADSFGCSVDTSFTIPVSDVDPTTFIPNVFTPNGDGVNDTWRIDGACFELLDCTIFNRWGSPVAELRALPVEWDGTVDGAFASTGVYAYVVRTLGSDGSEVSFQGHITLLR